MKLFLAGPMRGYPRFNVDAFDAAREKLRDAGHQVVCPVELDRRSGIDHDTLTLEEANQRTPELLEENYKHMEDCTDIAVLPGWSESEGALCEILEFMVQRHREVSNVHCVDIKGNFLHEVSVSRATLGELLQDVRGQKEAMAGSVNESEPGRNFRSAAEALANFEKGAGKLLKNGIHTFDTGSVRSSDADGVAFHLISPIGMRRLAETCREGEKKYSAYNWEKGQPVEEVLNHVIWHCYKYLLRDDSEDHLAHAAWGLFAAMHYEEVMPEMLNGLRPKPVKEEQP